MVSCGISEVFPRLYGSQAKAFVCLNHHEFQFCLDKANGSALVREEIVVDGTETELRFKGLVECPKASFECKGDVPGTRFPFLPDVDLCFGKRY